MSAVHVAVAAAPAAAPAAAELSDLADRVIDHPSGYLALSTRNQRFACGEIPGFISYREQGRHWIAFGGVHAPEASRGVLLDRFVAQAQQHQRRVIFVQVRQAQTELFRSRGFTVNQLGSSYALSLAGFSLAGARRLKLRNKIKRARALGVRIVSIGHELPADQATFAELQRISDAWLRRKRKKELDFMIGELGGPVDWSCRIFAALDATGAIVGFITYVPAWGKRPGWLHDLTRRLPSSPVGAMELCNATAIEQLVAERCEYLHFGFTPFLVSGQEGPSASPVLSWVLRMLARYGSFIYPAVSQAEYKLKWAPDLVEPEFVAARPLSLRAIIDLLLLTRSL
jgi:lysylphosphatidylglycerol synthetase-like protein (DUF2156 family)